MKPNGRGQRIELGNHAVPNEQADKHDYSFGVAILRGGEEWFFFGLMKVRRSVASQIALGSDGARLFMRPEMSPNSNPGVIGAAPRHVRIRLSRPLHPGKISDKAK